jgi:hypothetical protein
MPPAREIYDLRNVDFFRRWVKRLSGDARELLSHAAVEYLKFDDTLRMVFTHDMRERIESQGVCNRLIDHIRAFYGVNLQKWALSAGMSAQSHLPRHAVMPRVAVQIAPERKVSH